MMRLFDTIPVVVFPNHSRVSVVGAEDWGGGAQTSTLCSLTAEANDKVEEFVLLPTDNTDCSDAPETMLVPRAVAENRTTFVTTIVDVNGGGWAWTTLRFGLEPLRDLFMFRRWNPGKGD